MITIDFETKSHADLPKVGAWAYSEDPTTDIICLAYGIDCEPIQTWWPGKELEGSQVWPTTRKMSKHALQACDAGMPYDLYFALFIDEQTIEAHNVAFERALWANVLGGNDA